MAEQEESIKNEKEKLSQRERETQCRKCQQSWLKFEPKKAGCWRKSSNAVLVFIAAWSSPISALSNPSFYFVCSSSSENKALYYKFTTLNLLQVLEPSNGTSEVELHISPFIMGCFGLPGFRGGVRAKSAENQLFYCLVYFASLPLWQLCLLHNFIFLNQHVNLL